MVTRSELAATRAMGIPQEGRLSALSTQRSVGLTPEQQAVALAPVTMQTVEEAYAAATLAEAQSILSSLNPALTTTITLDLPFDSPTGATPQNTAARIATVPTGNPGSTIYSADITGAGLVTLRVNGVLGTTCVTGDSLEFRLTGAASSAVIEFQDNTTGAAICPAFTITTT